MSAERASDPLAIYYIRGIDSRIDRHTAHTYYRKIEATVPVYDLISLSVGTVVSCGVLDLQ
jgi:hypothetical protein